jgi:DNA-binding response OmpR family regulator
VERHELVGDAWGKAEAVGVSDEALDALLRRLRDRIASVDPTHNYIVTVRGYGVRLDNPPGE